jgi:hypothetical protein
MFIFSIFNLIHHNLTFLLHWNEHIQLLKTLEFCFIFQRFFIQFYSLLLSRVFCFYCPVRRRRQLLFRVEQQYTLLLTVPKRMVCFIFNLLFK